MFEGELIRLREYHKEDVPLAWKYVNDPEVRRNLTPGVPFPLRLEDEEKWYEQQEAGKDTYNFAIERKEDTAYIGGCGINEVDWKNRCVTVGIFIASQCWDKGYGTDAMKVLLRFVFEQMNIHRIELRTYSFNPRAIRSYEKCGFRKEAVLRQRIFRDSKYYDEVVMGILQDEWNELNL